MGKPSTTNPVRAVERFVVRAARWMAVCVVAMGLAGCVVRCGAQTALSSLVAPSGIVYDAQGNLYFAETGKHWVREFSAAGVLSTVAGTGVQGFAGDGGPATAAELDSPSGLAMDAAGNLYIADTHNQRVRRVSVGSGIITTVAGTGVAGFAGDGGAAIAARLARPTAIAMDAAGDLFIADTGNHRVRRIAAGTGVITTVAGNGVEGFGGDGAGAVAASIDSPNGIAVDGAGNLYIVDTHNGRVRRVDAATQRITTVAGTGGANGDVQRYGGDGGAAIAAGLALPRGLTLDAAGDLYVADSANQRIRRISSGGAITTVAGQGTQTFAGDGAPAVGASLDSPRAVAMSPGQLVTLADTGNGRVRQIDALAAPGPDIHTLPYSVSGVVSDFSIAATGANAQSAGVGIAAKFGFAVAMQGATLASPIALTVQGVPTGAAASLSAASLPASGAGTSFMLTLQDPYAAMHEVPRPGTSPLTPVLAVLLLPGVGWVARRKRVGLMLVVLLGSCVALMTGCGQIITPAIGLVKPGDYTLTVTGTATSATGAALRHAVSVTLVVK